MTTTTEKYGNCVRVSVATPHERYTLTQHKNDKTKVLVNVGYNTSFYLSLDAIRELLPAFQAIAATGSIEATEARGAL
jgi:hypothetical protein